jgi:hypothetical protein
MIFLSSSRQMLEYYLKLGHDCLILYTRNFQFIIILSFDAIYSDLLKNVVK